MNGASTGKATPDSVSPDPTQARLVRRNKLDASRDRIAARREEKPLKRVAVRSEASGAAADKYALKQQRMLRNRKSAALSRKRNTDVMKSLERQVEALEEENGWLHLRLSDPTDVGDVQCGNCPLCCTSASCTSGSCDTGETSLPNSSSATVVCSYNSTSRGFQHKHYQQHQFQHMCPHHCPPPQFLAPSFVSQFDQEHASLGEEGDTECGHKTELSEEKEMTLIHLDVDDEAAFPRFAEAFEVIGVRENQESREDTASIEGKRFELSRFLGQMIDG